MQPGIYDGISNEAYHSGDGLSRSALKLIIEKSPAHYARDYIHGMRKESTKEMNLGTMIHEAILEPHIFESKYEVPPAEIRGLRKNTNKYKDWYAEFTLANPNKALVSIEDYEAVQEIISNFKSNELCVSLFSEGKPEQTIYFNHDEHLCKVRPDWMKPNGIQVDIKSASDITKSSIERSCAKYFYHMQAAMYMDGWELATGEKYPMDEYGDPYYYYVFIETEYPFSIWVFRPMSAMIEKGRELYKEALDIYSYCLKTGKWPSSGVWNPVENKYEQVVDKICIPGWAF